MMGRSHQGSPPAPNAPTPGNQYDHLERRIHALEAENALLRAVTPATSQLHEVLERSLQAILVHRGAGPLYVNSAYVRLLGFESREQAMAATDLLQLIHPEDRAFVARHIAARLAGSEASASYEFRALRRDGSIAWIECLATTIDWEGLPAALGSLSDITARKRAEQALRRSEQLFVTVFNASPDMISLTTLEDGRYIDVNDSFLRLCGRRRQEVIGRTAREIDFWSEPGFRERMVDMLRRDGVVRDLETAVRASSGGVRNFSFSIELIRHEDRDLLLGIGRDITERRQHEAELRRSKEDAELANRAKSDFLANMSHELRTPLNAILGFSEVIRDQLFGPTGNPRYAAYARDIHGSGQHLLQIINDLLDISKLEAGKVDLHEAEVSLSPVLESCLRLVRDRANDGGVALRPELPAHFPAIRADERMLKQILINLLSNAVKFTPAGGTVRIGARLTEAGAIAIDVTDTGIGMSPREIEIALTPFGQVDGTLTRKHQGTGLGLPLAKSLIQLHGGELTIGSVKGQGTVVTVTLPPERLPLFDA